MTILIGKDARNMKGIVHIDGSMGEGGGQILRTSLALSMVTGKPLHVVNIRPRRGRPAIQRQHLAAIMAAQKVCSADVVGAQVGSSEIHFAPGKIAGGTYGFPIGSAGSATLVLQTILPALMLADRRSNITIEGGTHNIWAPPVDFLDKVFLPLLERMGPFVGLSLERHGFHPAGGGIVHAVVDPVTSLMPIDVNERGGVNQIKATAIVANLPETIGEREINTVRGILGNDIGTRVLKVDSNGPGNVLLIEIISDRIAEIVTSFGRRGLRAEKVAAQAAIEARTYIGSGVPVGMHLADQLVLPLSLAGGGSFTTMAATGHLKTNIDVITKFLPVAIWTDQVGPMAWKVTVGS